MPGDFRTQSIFEKPSNSFVVDNRYGTISEYGTITEDDGGKSRIDNMYQSQFSGVEPRADLQLRSIEMGGKGGKGGKKSV